MSFHKDQMFYDDNTLTEDGVSAELLVGAGTYDITLIVKSVSASDSVVFSVTESVDGTTYTAVDDFLQITQAGVFHLKVAITADWIQIAHNVTGTDVSIVVTGGITRGVDGAVTQ